MSDQITVLESCGEDSCWRVSGQQMTLTHVTVIPADPGRGVPERDQVSLTLLCSMCGCSKRIRMPETVEVIVVDRI